MTSLTVNRIQYAVATAGIIGSVGAISVASAASPMASPNSHTSGYNKDQCKDGGWKTFKNADGSMKFKNQGQCVEFFETGGKNDHDNDDHGRGHHHHGFFGWWHNPFGSPGRH
jgi:hypothetical protein